MGHGDVKTVVHAPPFYSTTPLRAVTLGATRDSIVTNMSTLLHLCRTPSAYAGGEEDMCHGRPSTMRHASDPGRRGL
jgi:hypothetical protein